MHTAQLKAIQTAYNGYWFRSRLEARWAVFFDQLGVDWEYETEGYDLGDGVYYLPDFLLKGVTIDHGFHYENVDLYVEVKGRMNDEDAMKVRKFYEAGQPSAGMIGLSQTPVLVVGAIPNGVYMNEIIRDIQEKAYTVERDWPEAFNFQTIDGDYFAAYPGVDEKGVFTLFGDDQTYLINMDEHATEKAYRNARHARFEFGDTPDGRMNRRLTGCRL